MKILPDVDFLLECFDVTPDGVLVWKDRPIHHFKNEHSMKAFNSKFSSTIVSCREKSGYLVVKLNGSTFKVHRILWKIWKGEDPDFIDHINGIRDDNKPDNIRNVTRSENNRNKSISINNTSGNTGVSYHSRDNTWQAYITCGGKRIHIGYFDTKEAAQLSRKFYEEKFYGEYNRKS